MPRSMTGYGRSERFEDGTVFRVEVRSVNHRFQEVTVRMPRELLQLEEIIKKEVQTSFARGRIDVFVTIEPNTSASTHATIDWAYAEQVVQSVRELKSRFNLPGELHVSDFVHIPEMWTSLESEDRIEAWREPLLAAAREACAALSEMRLLEGRELARDILNRVERIREHLAVIRERAPLVVTHYRERIAERIEDFLTELEIDEARLLTEAALFAEKCNIDEELTRLDSHCNQLQHILSLTEPVGRKLDFLVQEMNREINTIGSKANDLTISRGVVEVKSELEKIREQVQNIE